jgi:hypothetical protein
MQQPPFSIFHLPVTNFHSRMSSFHFPYPLWKVGFRGSYLLEMEVSLTNVFKINDLKIPNFI